MSVARAQWTSDELRLIGDTDELEIASRRADGSLRRYITIWVVRAGDGIYVRSAHGWENGWFQRALHSGSGRIRVPGVEHDAAFELVDDGDIETASVTQAYHAKYARYGASIVGTVVSDEAGRTTLRVLPLDPA